MGPNRHHPSSEARFGNIRVWLLENKKCGSEPKVCWRRLWCFRTIIKDRHIDS